MTAAEVLPHFNACMNVTSAVSILAGIYFIKHKRIDEHRRCMLTAVVASTVFLAGYITRHVLTGTTYFQGPAVLHRVYLGILYSHMALAVLTVPLVIRLLYLIKKERVDDHKRLARWTAPVWLYVSITGVVVYMFLYHISEV